eukprot:6635130-Karenia_brevis.AAC.1
MMMMKICPQSKANPSPGQLVGQKGAVAPSQPAEKVSHPNPLVGGAFAQHASNRNPLRANAPGITWTLSAHP